MADDNNVKTVAYGPEKTFRKNPAETKKKPESDFRLSLFRTVPGQHVVRGKTTVLATEVKLSTKFVVTFFALTL